MQIWHKLQPFASFKGILCSSTWSRGETKQKRLYENTGFLTDTFWRHWIFKIRIRKNGGQKYLDKIDMVRNNRILNVSNILIKGDLTNTSKLTYLIGDVVDEVIQPPFTCRQLSNWSSSANNITCKQ